MEEFGSKPGLLNLTAYQGDTFYRKITLTAPDSTPVDLTDMIVEFSIAVARGGRPAYVYSTDNFISMDDPTLGEFEIYIPAGDAEKWNLGRYVYDVTVKDGLGYAKTFLTGYFSVAREVAK